MKVAETRSPKSTKTKPWKYCMLSYMEQFLNKVFRFGKKWEGDFK